MNIKFRPCLSLKPQHQFGNSTFFVLLWKPLYIPSTDPFDIPQNKFERIKVECGDRIETNVEQNQGPLEEGIFGVSWVGKRVSKDMSDYLVDHHGITYHQGPCALCAG